MNDGDSIPVTDLKQWSYCPRIVYYHRVLSAAGKPTFKMREAVHAQDLIESLETRRTIDRYGLAGAERRFNVWLRDDGWGMSGKADLILEAADQVAVVDFKLTSGEIGDNHRMQLAAYALLAEKLYQKASMVAFLYRIPDNGIFAVDITLRMRDAVVASTKAIRAMVEDESFPPPTTVRGRCAECEYANFCADIW